MYRFGRKLSIMATLFTSFLILVVHTTGCLILLAIFELIVSTLLCKMRKDMQVRENLALDNNHRLSVNTRFSRRRSYTLSLTTLLLLGAVFVCTLLAVSLIIYNFGTCEQLRTADGEEIVCTSVRSKQPAHDIVQDSNTNRDKYEKDVRLPRAIKPLAYNISITPILEAGNFTFYGLVQIRILILHDCYNVTMHATNLDISKEDVLVRHADNNDEKLRIRKQYLLEAKQFFVIELYDKLVKGTEYMLHIKFSGMVMDYLQGFYRSSYHIGNETRWLASTQFQPTDARRAFPCFDEPALKAKFTMHIARPKNMSTISNMPIVSTAKHESLHNYVWDHYAQSLPMSTYLVAFAVTDFAKLSYGNFSVWTRADAINSAQYALQIGPKILSFLENYFDLQFPLPKMDMLALPDFQPGAMENWGLITYRETTMLYEENVSATINKNVIAIVVGHELAHQWFGNLVTPSWWTDIWLNEGFATYMEYIAVDAVEPGWKLLEQFVVNELHNVFHLDALSTSHKISIDVFNPDEIFELFDRISYTKGAAIIRMMSHFLTSTVFRRGISKYLREMAYNSATQDDLWHFLTVEATKAGLLDNSTTVKEIMDTWTLQTGYPVVHISREPHTHLLRLEQSRFVFVNETKVDDNGLWWIPITYTTSSDLDFQNTRPLTWMPQSKVYEIENQNLSEADWFIFNIQETGYYRVNYELNNWRAITHHLMQPHLHTDIAPTNRAQLINDAMNLAYGGYLEYEMALNLTRYLQHEYDYAPWKAAISAFIYIHDMFVNEGDYDLLKNYLLKLLANVYDEVGFIDDMRDHDDMLKLYKRYEVLNIACVIGHRNCTLESIRYFQEWMRMPYPDKNNPISPNLRSIVYEIAIQYGSEIEWDFAFERYRNSIVSNERDLLLTALGATREPWLLHRYLRRSISGEAIRKQDVHRIFAAVSSHVVGQRVAFDFMRQHWREIKTFSGSPDNLHMLLKFATKNMNNNFLLAELKSFVENELKENARTIRQSVEQVQVNVNWMKRNYKKIVHWLQQEAVFSAAI